MAAQSDNDQDLLHLESYTATISEIDQSSLPLLHELAISVFWPHRARDIEFFMSLGQGYIACDEIGRPLGSTMYCPMGEDFAMFGMMVVTPRLQAQGVGRCLLRKIMSDCQGRDLRLTATRSAYRLYESAGFTPVAEISQHQGIARRISLPEGPERGVLRAMVPTDTPAILSLDAHAYGADRTAIYAALLEKSKGVVLEDKGEIKGFAMSRNFGKGTVIGPVVAEDDLMAMQLAAMLIEGQEGKFLRCDTWSTNEKFRSFLSAAGLGVFDSVTEMRVGPSRRSTTGARLFAMASHSLG